MPVGYRRELSNVRNAQLKLARQLARLEDMELDASRELTQALRALNTNYRLAQTHFNRWVAATTEVESVLTSYKEGNVPLDTVLVAQRRRAQSQIAYYTHLTEYNKTIALVHRRKGTSLDYCGVTFAEGPWVGKAYVDAQQHARRRAASREMNYAFTRPGVVSQGPRPAAAGSRTTDWSNRSYEGFDVEEGLPVEGMPGVSSDPFFGGGYIDLPEQGLELEEFIEWGPVSGHDFTQRTPSAAKSPNLGDTRGPAAANGSAVYSRRPIGIQEDSTGSYGVQQVTAIVNEREAAASVTATPRAGTTPATGQTYRPTRKSVAQIRVN